MLITKLTFVILYMRIVHITSNKGVLCFSFLVLREAYYFLASRFKVYLECQKCRSLGTPVRFTLKHNKSAYMMREALLID